MALPWSRRLQIAAPLAAGLVLIGTCVTLLVRHWSDDRPPASRAPAGAAAPRAGGAIDERFAVHPREVPRVSPTEMAAGVQPHDKAARGPKRWNIHPLPAGWDPELAAKLAALFGRVDFDPSDPDTFSDAGKAMEELKAYLASLGPEALPTMAAILKAEPAYVLRLQVLEAIGQLGAHTDAATFVLKDYFQSRMQDLEARSEMNHVIKAMGALKNDSSHGAILGMIDTPGMPSYYQDKLIIELGEHPLRAESKDVFRTLMIENHDNNVRNHSAQAYGKFGTPADLPDLYDAYEREQRRGHWVVRQTILGSIGKIGDPSSVPFLEQEARFAKEDGVRLSAASALRRIGNNQANAILHDLSNTEPNAGVRGRIIGWLANR